MSPLAGITAYETFIRLVGNNIGTIPDLRLDEAGYTHRIQIFRDAGVLPKVLFSKRALARYKARLDSLNYGIAKKSTTALCDASCLLLGRDLLLTNRFVGTAFVTKAFKTMRATATPESEVFSYMLQGVKDLDQAAMITFLHPLAHEIGHCQQSQALGPKDIWSEKFLDTYQINYEAIYPIIGDLDYAGRRDNRQSPLFLPLLREEVISDWFAVTSVFFTIYETAPAQEFHLLAVMLNLIMFPLVTAYEETCLKEWQSREGVQEVLLANQCRFSVLIDSMRSVARHLFPNNIADVDEAISVAEAVYHDALSLIWDTAVRLNKLTRELMNLSDNEIIDYVGRETAPEQREHLHKYLRSVLDDSAGYPLWSTNRTAFARVFDRMMVFDTVLITDRGVYAFPKSE